MLNQFRFPQKVISFAVAAVLSGLPCGVLMASEIEYLDDPEPDPKADAIHQTAEAMREALNERMIEMPWEALVEFVGENPSAAEDFLKDQDAKVLNAVGTAKIDVAGEGTLSGDIGSFVQASVYAHDSGNSEGLLGYYASAIGAANEAAVLGRRDEESAYGYLAYHTEWTTYPLTLYTYGVYGSANAATGTNYGVYGASNRPGSYGVYAYNGSGRLETGVALYAKNTASGAGVDKILKHTAVVENTEPDTASGLAVYLSGNRKSAVAVSDNFVTFYVKEDGSENPIAIGAIEGNGSGGVTLNTSAGDFAEWLERSDHGEEIGPGDLVGVRDGKVSKSLAGAQQIKVVSSGPAVSGASPAEAERVNYERIAFLGQVPVKVVGKVKSGDFILPSGGNDGTGIAFAPEKMAPADFRKAVGQAWESSAEEGVKLVRIAVGMGTADGSALLERQNERIQQLEQQLADQKADLAAMSRQLEQLNRQMAALRAGSGLAVK